MQNKFMSFLTRSPLFEHLSSSELDRMMKKVKCVRLDQGKILCKEGDPGTFMCFVVDGKLEIYKESASHTRVKISEIGKGKTIGDMAIIDHTPRSATVAAKTDVDLIILKKEDFDSILESDPHIGIKVLKGLTRLLSMNLRKTSSRLADYMLPMT